MRKIILAGLAVVLAASCKDSVDEPSINPITQEILTNGLNISASGADTTIVFPSMGESKVEVSYFNGEQQWCAASESLENGEVKLNIKCQPSSTSLTKRQAKIVLSSDSRSYEVIVSQVPLAQAYADKTVYYMPNDGGTLTIPIHANTTFRVDRALYVIGTGENTRYVDTSWLGISNEHENVTADADNIYKLEVKAQLNTGLGRNAFLSIYGDSIKSSSVNIEIRQEPRRLNESESIDVTRPYSLPLEILLGNDSTNLRRMKNLSFIGQVYPERLEYFAGLANLTLDTLDLSEAFFSKYSKEEEREIETRRFFKSPLRSISLPKDLLTIGEESFAECPNLETIAIPSTVTRIEERAFAESSNIRSISIPQDSKLTYVGSEAFHTGDVIESLFIPSTATNMSSLALVGLQAKELHIGLTTPPTMSGTVYSGCTLYVPKGCVEKYRSADYWKDYKTIVEE